jgi:acyl-CoA thioester hydrolase
MSDGASSHSDGSGSGADGTAPFAYRERVRFGDLDAMQHMNNVEFLRFFETARIEWLRSLFPEHSPTRRERFGFIFAECRISYRSPAFYDDVIRTDIRPGRVGRSSLHVEFTMHAEGDERLVAEGHGVLVGYDYEEGHSRPLPDELRERLADETPAA